MQDASASSLSRTGKTENAYNCMQLGEDMFVMQTLDSSLDIHTPGRDSMESALGFTPNPRAGLADIDFDAALTL